MKKTVLAMLLIVLVMFTVTANGSQEAPAQENEPIKVGLMFARSGALGLMGEESLQAALIAIDQINERGGINGRMLLPVISDVPDTTAAQSEANRLTQKEGVKIFFGTYGSALSSVMTGVINRNGGYYMEVISVADGITDRDLDGIYRLHFKGSVMGESAIDFLAKLCDDANIPYEDAKLALFYENSDFGMSTGIGYKDGAAKLGMEVVVDESYSKDTPDTSPLVLKAKAADANFVIMTPYINDAINFVKNSKNMNFSPLGFVGLGTGFSLPVFWETLGSDAQGMFDCDPLQTPALATMAPSMIEPYKEFTSIVQEKLGHDPIVVNMLTWQAVWLVANEVLMNAEDPEDVAELSRLTDALDFPLGSLPTGHGVDFDSTGQNQRCQIGGMQWQDGSLVNVYPEAMATNDVVDFPFAGWK
ncbi:MAG: ABC transporter substrate-binding protein [Spirochaetia bacterium]|nr:ABC transporter substrate-binding protein [Spirochaetia bacterium]